MANRGVDDRLGRGFGNRPSIRSKLVQCFDIALLKSKQLRQKRSFIAQEEGIQGSAVGAFVPVHGNQIAMFVDRVNMLDGYWMPPCR